jgi:repressor LexA
MKGLTERQGQVLEAILSSMEETGHFPSYREIGRELGLSSVATVSQHIEALVAKGALRRAGDTLLVSPALRKDRGIPIVGRVAAGAPVTAVEHLEGTLDLRRLAGGSGASYAVRVKGDSMIEAGICEGDLAVVRIQPTAESGDTVVAYLGEEQEATVKVLYRRSWGYELHPRNRDYEIIKIRGDDPHFRLGGKVVAVVRSLSGAGSFRRERT